jgi:hypothetical protein
MQIQKLFFKVLVAAGAVCLAVFLAVSLFGCENTPGAITSGVLSQGGAEAEKIRICKYNKRAVRRLRIGQASGRYYRIWGSCSF